MATKIGLYNDALRVIGERTLATLTEAREPRRVLDDAYDGAIKYCLEQGFWKFAQRTQKLTASTTTIPVFGYKYAFEKPSDCVKLFRISDDENFNSMMLDYGEEGGFWLSHSSVIYIAYISDDVLYGNDLVRWPETFSTYVGYYLASQVVERLAPANASKIPPMLYQAHEAAKAKDAMQGPPEFFPIGGWTAARSRFRSNRRDRGNRGQLIG